MAFTKQVRHLDVWGSSRVAFEDLTFDDSYPTGGLDFDTVAESIPKIDFVICFGNETYDAIYMEDTSKILLRDRASGNEPTPGADLSSVTIHTFVVGH